MSTPRKESTPNTRTNKRARKAELNKLRGELIDTYHGLSRVSCDDAIAESGKVTRPGEEDPDRLGQAIGLVSDAINYLNEELGRKPNSPK